MNPADLGPVRPDERTQSPADVFLVFAGANVVATTIVTGASLPAALPTRDALLLVVSGAVAGAALVAALVPAGVRLGVPTVVAARAALGRWGAGLVAAVLAVANFAWIALNNVIAASACAQLLGGRASERAWAFALGLLATAVVAAGPRAVARADRLAVPLMSVITVVLLASLAGHPAAFGGGGAAAGDLPRGFDLVVGYQVSWLLMFADYARYTRSPRASGAAVLLALAATSVAFMTIGALGARVSGSTDPADMLASVGWTALGAPLLALATLTTNFVNIYTSALAWKSLRPAASSLRSVWTIGAVGAALSILSRAWLDRYGAFMLLLGATLVPVGGMLLARFFVVRAPVRPEALYAADLPRLPLPAAAAWMAGVAAYLWGGTIPGLAATVAVYVGLHAALGRPAPAA